MKFFRFLRKVWHDSFYGLNVSFLKKTAHTCRHVVESIDLTPQDRSPVERARFYLHLSLCQACKNYYDYSRLLSKKIKEGRGMTPVKAMQPSLSLHERLMKEASKPVTKKHE